MLIDTHCHLDDPLLKSRLPQVLVDARKAGVGHIIIPGFTADGWAGIGALAAANESVSAAYGIHPLWASDQDESVLPHLADLASQAVAIGEIGLDYHRPEPTRDIQQKTFRMQLRLAVELGLPVLIHCRNAFQDLLRILREEKVTRVGGIMHAFSGSVETARECIDLGLLISVSGTVTWSNAVKPVDVVRRVPLEHLVLETDAPDMTPEQYRGRPNEPGFILEVARRVAEIKGVPLEDVGRITSSNAQRIFRLRGLEP